MKWVTRIWAESFPLYEVGQEIIYGGKPREIEQVHNPRFPGDSVILFLKGEKYGMSLEYIGPMDDYSPPPDLEDPETLLTDILAEGKVGPEIAERIRNLLAPR